MQWPTVPIRVGVAGAVALLALTGCSGGSRSDKQPITSGPISFAVADTSGAMKLLADRWNSEHPGQQVSITTLPSDPAARRDQLVENLQNHAAGYDVVATDLSAIPELAASRWISPLTAALAVDTSGSVRQVVADATWSGTLYAAPLTAETGLLYYRSDLLKTAPTSWSALVSACSIATANSLACYSGQFAQGPSLGANALEAIYAAGGRLLSPDGKTAVVDTENVRKGLQFLVDSYRKNVIPQAAITYQREQSVRAFGSSALLMLRAEADDYAALSAKSSPIYGKVGVAALPGPSGPAPAVFTGIGASINAAATHRRTALDFLRFLQSPDAQKRLLTDASLPPALMSVYTDPAVRSTYPFLDVLRADWATGVAEPVSTQFQAINDALAESAYTVMTGTASVAQATKSLQATISALPLS
jgi:multiple sugar transport system substrate-binding protein